jgi:2-hydroxy-6-oxonona-2,4-dienedioate hydrolase
MDNGEPRFPSMWQKLSLTPHEYGWVDAGGIRTRYVRAGAKDAPALIMLPGTAGTIETFYPSIGPHARHFNVFAIDMLGSGFTDKPDHDYEIHHYVEHLKNFMAAVGLRRASLFGVSLGSWAAARFAITHPDMVEKLTLVSVAGMTANAETMKRVASGRSGAADDPSWKNIGAIFEVLIYDEKNRVTDIMAMRQAAYRQPEMKQAMQHILCLQKMEIRQRNLIREEEWRRIAAPTLVVGSKNDRETDHDKVAMVGAWMPNARTEMMEGVGHWPHLEAADFFNELNIGFLRGTG